MRARSLARRVGLSPTRRLGQNFLVDRGVLDSIVAALGLTGGEIVVEIGSGLGTLTLELATRAHRVIAVDIDPGCVRATTITVRALANVSVIRMDALHLDPDAAGAGSSWVAAGNIPYNLTSALLGHLFELPEPPSRAVFLVQREVARRLAAAPGDWGISTVAIRSLATVEILGTVGPASFDPSPAVHSAIIRMRPRKAFAEPRRAAVLALARAAFQLRRKTLRHGVTRACGGDRDAALAALGEVGIDPSRRPETLSLGEWHDLAGALPGR